MRVLFLISILFLVASCGVNTSGNININPSDIQIIRKGDLCFGFIASRKSFTVSTTGLGFTYIPCEKLKGMTNVYQESSNELK